MTKKVPYTDNSRELELIIEQQAEELHLLRSGQKQLPIPAVSNLLCGYFEPDNKTSSATKCKCGREKWEHPKVK